MGRYISKRHDMESDTECLEGPYYGANPDLGRISLVFLLSIEVAFQNRLTVVVCEPVVIELALCKSM